VKGKARFVLTAACMATQWLKAVTLISITVKAVAEAVVDIIGRMGLLY